MSNELLTIRDVMNTRPRTLSPDMPILRAIEFLLRNDTPCVPVVDDRRHVVGVISEKDCLRLVAEGDALQHEVPHGVVADFMTAAVVSLPPGMDIYYAAGRFLQEPYRRYPVIENGVLVGEISRRDLLRHVQAGVRATQWEVAGSA